MDIRHHSGDRRAPVSVFPALLYLATEAPVRSMNRE